MTASSPSGDAILVDIAMRDYISVRADMTEQRRQTTNIVMGSIAAIAVGFSAVAVLGQAHIGTGTLALLLLAGAVPFEIGGMVLIGCDGSFKILEDLNRRQAGHIRGLLGQVSDLPIPDTLLSLQDEVQAINKHAPSGPVWLASFGAWSVAGFVLPLLAILCAISGVGLTFSSGASGAWSIAALVLVAVDLVGGTVLAGLALLDLQLPGRLEGGER